MQVGMDGRPAMAPQRGASIVAIKFWTEYQPDESGTLMPFDKVEFAPVGRTSSTIRDRVARLIKNDPSTWDALARPYEHWKKGEVAPTEGTPLSAWPGISEGQIGALKAMHIRTVEDLATCPDSALDRLMGGRGLQAAAQAFVNNAEPAAAARRIADLEAKLAAQGDQIAELLAAQAVKPRRGRPPKDRDGDAGEGDDE